MSSSAKYIITEAKITMKWAKVIHKIRLYIENSIRQKNQYQIEANARSICEEQISADIAVILILNPVIV